MQYLQRQALSSDVNNGNIRGCHIRMHPLKPESTENLTLDPGFKRPQFQCSKSTVACGQNSKTRNITSRLQNLLGWCGRLVSWYIQCKVCLHFKVKKPVFTVWHWSSVKVLSHWNRYTLFWSCTCQRQSRASPNQHWCFSVSLFGCLMLWNSVSMKWNMGLFTVEWGRLWMHTR